MDKFVQFLYELLMQFFLGFKNIFIGLYEGIIEIFNVNAYIAIINYYKADFSILEWILAGISILLILALLGFFIFLIYLLIRKYIRFRQTVVEQESLLEEVASLNQEVAKMMKEKEDILAMKVSNLGIKPSIEGEEEADDTSEEDDKPVGDTRFAKLTQVDEEYENYKVKIYDNTFTLPELIDNFRNFAASKLHLYYSETMIRTFISSLSCTKLVILQGISGTGKTSLAYAWGKFLKHDSCVASVQPSWRDRTELFGYFNEFTKKFNETDVLKQIYEANYTDEVYTVILDEMNIARVEYYFAEMLSILEMPDKNEWVVELVSSGWKSDPKMVINGKLQLPVNIWYIGTINNDDSTFMVTDKVYDRAMPIDINDKGQVFKAKDVEAQDINYTYLQALFDDSYVEHPMSKDSLDKIEILDNYVIQHFRIAFGNRIVMQMQKFVPTYMACNGDEVDGIDYFLARKVLRKFEQLNISYIRDEIDGFVDFIDKTFGKDKMKECKEYLLRLKKMS